MKADPESSSESIPHIVFRPVWGYGVVVFVVSGILIAVLTIWLARGSGDGQASPLVLIVAAFMALAVGVNLLLAVTRVETGPDGLLVSYLLRPTRLILWPDVTRVCLSLGRGHWLNINHLRDSRGNVTSFPVGYTTTRSRENADALIQAITEAAHLNRKSKTFWDGPCYERGDPDGQNP